MKILFLAFKSMHISGPNHLLFDVVTLCWTHFYNA